MNIPSFHSPGCVRSGAQSGATIPAVTVGGVPTQRIRIPIRAMIEVEALSQPLQPRPTGGLSVSAVGSELDRDRDSVY